MQKGYQFRLIPTKEQEQYFKQAAGTARWMYNLCISEDNLYYSTHGEHLNGSDIRQRITYLKKIYNPKNKTTIIPDEQPLWIQHLIKDGKDYSWLWSISNNVTKQSAKDYDKAILRFKQRKAGPPKYKSKHKNKDSFYVERLQFRDNNTVRIEMLDSPIKLGNDAKKFGLSYLTKNNIPIQNPRIKFDGFHWYISFSVDMPNNLKPSLTQETIGIDLGIKETTTLSNGKQYHNINKTKEIRRLTKKKKKLQRKLNRQLLINTFGSTKGHTLKKGVNIKRTKNSDKTQRQINQVTRRMTNIRQNYNHQMTTEIVKTKPSQIVLEDLSVKNMMKNKHLARSIQEQNLYEIRTMLTYKAQAQGTEIIIVPRNYASSQICSCCKSKQSMPLHKRTYKCPNCNTVIDRDLNAAINLRNYGLCV